MNDISFAKSKYLELRGSLIRFLEKLDAETYFYQPTSKSNSAAWIVPHISAFEKIMVTDRISGFEFDEFIGSDDVAKYKPGVDGFSFKEKEMMGIDDAIALLKRTQEVSIGFLDAMIEGTSSAKNVDIELAFNQYLFNFSHETEHYGQLKYLLGTWRRTSSE